MREAYRVLKQERVPSCSTDGRGSMSSLKPGRKLGSSLSGTWCSRSSTARRGASFTINTSRHICWPKGVPRCRSDHSAM
jgi:hypothetical protein